MNKFLFNIFFASFLFSFGACQLEDPQALISNDDYNCQALNVGGGESLWEESTPYGIDSIWFQQNCVIFDLAFTGGCEEHDFNLWWNGKVNRHLFIDKEDSSNIIDTGDSNITSGTGIESIDEIEGFNKVPLIVLYLVHDDANESCEALIQESRSFNLTDLQQNDYPEVRLEVHSVSGTYAYQYTWK